MASSRSTNTVSEGLRKMVQNIGDLKMAVDGAIHIDKLVALETQIIQIVSQIENGANQPPAQAGAAPPMGAGMGGMPGGGAMLGGGSAPGMAPTGMGPPGMPGAPGPGVPGLRRSTPINPDELQRLMTNQG